MELLLLHMSAFGALLHVLGSVLIVYGQTVVKMAHCIAESSAVGASWLVPTDPRAFQQWRRPDGKWRPQYLGSKVYAAAGWVAFALGNALRFVSMRFAPQTTLSGLGSLQFPLIFLASYNLLGIKPHLVLTGIGVGVVLFGNILILIAGPSNETFSLIQLRQRWGTYSLRVFVLCLLFALALLHLAWRIVHHKRRKAEADIRAGKSSRFAKDASVHSGEFKQFASSNAVLGDDMMVTDPDNLRTFTAALLFSAVSSIIGAWSVLFSKSLTYVVSAAPASLADPYSWFAIVAFVVTAWYWVWQSNKGLRLYPATLIMPLMQAFWMVMSILEGMIYFDETRNLDAVSMVMLVLGLALALTGAVAMGLTGYFVERPSASVTAPPPSLSTIRSRGDLESNGVYQGGIVNALYVAQKDSGMTQYNMGVKESDIGLVEVSGRAEGFSSPVWRDKVPVSAALGAELTQELNKIAQWQLKNRQRDGLSRGWETLATADESSAPLCTLMPEHFTDDEVSPSSPSVLPSLSRSSSRNPPL